MEKNFNATAAWSVKEIETLTMIISFRRCQCSKASQSALVGAPPKSLSV